MLQTATIESLPVALEMMKVMQAEGAEWARTIARARRFREVHRRTRPMGTFQDKTSMERILFAGFMHENRSPDTSFLTLPRKRRRRREGARRQDLTPAAKALLLRLQPHRGTCR
jgi:hypothetical protein